MLSLLTAAPQRLAEFFVKVAALTLCVATMLVFNFIIISPGLLAALGGYFLYVGMPGKALGAFVFAALMGALVATRHDKDIYD